MEKELKLGLIGAGRIGRLHAENIVSNFKDVKLRAVSDLFYDKLTDWAKGLGIEKVTGDYRDILNDPAIDAVLVCSSTDTHAQISIEAARAGKHIFCEKPVDRDADRIRQVIKAVEEAGVKFQVGFNRRFDTNFKKVYDMVREGKVGKVHIVKITSRDPAPPPLDYIRVSGGIFLDMTIHDFDMVRYLTGSEVTEVFAQGASLVDEAIGKAGDIDTAIIVLKFADGAMGVIDNSRKAAYGYDQRIEVFGSEGCAAVANETESLAVLSSASGVWSEKPRYFFLERYRESFIREIRAFIDSILGNTETPVGALDGLQPVLIGIAARESLISGKAVKVQIG